MELTVQIQIGDPKDAYLDSVAKDVTCLYEASQNTYFFPCEDVKEEWLKAGNIITRIPYYGGCRIAVITSVLKVHDAYYAVETFPQPHMNDALSTDHRAFAGTHIKMPKKAKKA